MGECGWKWKSFSDEKAKASFFVVHVKYFLFFGRRVYENRQKWALIRVQESFI